MTIKKLPSGFWHVRFGPNRFVQWAEGATPCPDDTFWFYDADKEYAVQRAGQAVEDRKETR